MTKGWLSGWKAIANYIDRSVKTAKKYHKRYGMPVRRGPRNMPMALPHELDGWLRVSDGKKEEVYGYVYFAEAENGLIKIGYSGDLNNRIRNLNGGSPIKIQLLASKPGTKNDEEKLHAKFKKYRKRGEWFEANSKLSDYIKEINMLQESQEK